VLVKSGGEAGETGEADDVVLSARHPCSRTLLAAVPRRPIGACRLIALCPRRTTTRSTICGPGSIRRKRWLPAHSTRSPAASST
jgi:ABC-type glutathione transport system ATPase component